MNERRHGLHKDVSTIFRGSTLPAEAVCHRSVSPATGVSPSGPQVPARPRQMDAPVAKQTSPVRDERIEALRHTVECTQDHLCYRSGFSTLCRARPMLGGYVVECLEQGSHCFHRFPLLRRALCRCAIRQYVARRLRR
jgi:hypothetical protein